MLHLKKRRNHKIISLIVITALIFTVVALIPFNASATQDRTENFNKNFTLTGNRPADLVAVATAQLEMEEGQLGFTEYWCADFVYNCVMLANIPDSVIPYVGSVDAIYAGIMQRGAVITDAPRAGDLCFYRTPAGEFKHISIVCDSSRTTIHGNASWCAAGGPTRNHVCKRPVGLYESAMNETATYVRPLYEKNQLKINLPVKTVSLDTTKNKTFSLNATIEGTVTDLQVAFDKKIVDVKKELKNSVAKLTFTSAGVGSTTVTLTAKDTKNGISCSEKIAVTVVDSNVYPLTVSGFFDKEHHDNCDGIALFDVYVNGMFYAADVTSFQGFFTAGTTYSIINIRPFGRGIIDSAECKDLSGTVTNKGSNPIISLITSPETVEEGIGGINRQSKSGSKFSLFVL